MQKELKGQCPVCDELINFSDVKPLSTVKCPKCETALVVPWEFGRYQITEENESYSRFFNFYTAYDNRDNKKVRIGILKKDIEEYDFWLEKCRTEAKFIQTLEHQNVILITGYGMENGMFYFAEEFYEGFTIEEYDPNKVGELEVQSVITFCKKLAYALDAIHHKEFVHHMIEPKNIFVTKEGELKIMNLLSSRLEYAIDEKTGTHKFTVSPYYISPEKAEKGAEDRKGDIFSFGVFMYYYLTGDYPYNGDTEEEIIYSRVKRNKGRGYSSSSIEFIVPNPITNYRKNEIREKVAELIERLIKPYPIQRPSAGEFLAELKLIDAEEDRKEAELRRRHFLDNTKTIKIPSMERLSDRNNKL